MFTVSITIFKSPHKSKAWHSRPFLATTQPFSTARAIQQVLACKRS